MHYFIKTVYSKQNITKEGYWGQKLTLLQTGVLHKTEVGKIPVLYNDMK